RETGRPRPARRTAPPRAGRENRPRRRAARSDRAGRSLWSWRVHSHAAMLGQMQKMPRLAALSLIVPLALSACAAARSAAPDPAPLPDASSVALGQRAYADGPIIQPVQVLEDSRCPENVMCV